MNEIEEIKIKIEQEEDHGCDEIETNHEHLEIVIKLEDESIGYPDEENMEPFKNHESELFENSCRDVKGNDDTSPEETNPQNYELSIKLEDDSKPPSDKNQSAKSIEYLGNRNSENINAGRNYFDQFSVNEEINSKIGEEITFKFEDGLDSFHNHENANLQECFEAIKTDNSNNDDLTSVDGFDYDQSIRPFKCNECGERFYQESTLTRHKRIHKECKYRCKQCDKCYNSKKNLIQHQKDFHEGLRPFRCDECHKAFCRKNHLTIHKRTVHEGIKAFECQECGTSFGHKSALTLHQRTVHEGIKGFECQECGKSFGHKYVLKRHHRIVHEGIKAFECQECGKSFGQKSTLTSHKRTVHEGVKAFKCQECGKSFGQKTNLFSHQRTVHECVKAFKCQECGKCFSTKSCLKRHQRTVHDKAF